MKVLDAKDRLMLILSAHTAWARNPEIGFPEWGEIRRDMYELMAEIGDEARCEHNSLTDGVCMICGRKPNVSNTLEKEVA